MIEIGTNLQQIILGALAIVAIAIVLINLIKRI